MTSWVCRQKWVILLWSEKYSWIITHTVGPTFSLVENTKMHIHGWNYQAAEIIIQFQNWMFSTSFCWSFSGWNWLHKNWTNWKTYFIEKQSREVKGKFIFLQTLKEQKWLNLTNPRQTLNRTIITFQIPANESWTFVSQKFHDKFSFFHSGNINTSVNRFTTNWSLH